MARRGTFIVSSAFVAFVAVRISELFFGVTPSFVLFFALFAVCVVSVFGYYRDLESWAWTGACDRASGAQDDGQPAPGRGPGTHTAPGHEHTTGRTLHDTPPEA